MEILLLLLVSFPSTVHVLKAHITLVLIPHWSELSMGPYLDVRKPSRYRFYLRSHASDKSHVFLLVKKDMLYVMGYSATKKHYNIHNKR
jgi:hypothetical protein